MEKLSCFKAYDLRGKVPDELNPTLAYRLGRAYADRYQPACVALGRDVRHTSLPLQQALAAGLASRGVDVIDLGLGGTEETYFAAQQPGVDGAIMVTASHNPMEYNGMKLVGRGALPISGDSGLNDLERATREDDSELPAELGAMREVSCRGAYVQHLLAYVKDMPLRPLKIVVNAGNGGAGLLIDALAPHLPFEFVRIHHEPDGDFPNGIPNPLLPENRASTSKAVVESGADFGVAWDGDFDRCFLFDERGEFIEGYYIVGLLAETMLKREPGAKIIHDPRLTWNTVDVVTAAGGVPVLSKTGHAFIKERMRLEDAIYGGEMSAHHYFREFAYCDNGNIPWLLVAALMSVRGETLSSLVEQRIAKFPSSGEINRRVDSITETIARIEARYAPQALVDDRTDGLSLEFADWRFNLRGSNTEPVLRLNVESRGDIDLMKTRTAEILALIGGVD
ncbi:phosphomannomutase [Algiphilus sp. W345]|uniref:phosphomannomutase n=1 Tax=Banduia mediterranea TaxID=3075609 RepID=A0ABU2WE13_9GAMM|nr:phosphomannomutase [Algiphilus sp. W345]MDT0496118.1 phosphomannomutase [Algiphilus sp. W345]